ncbi:MAG: hypothetical protein WA414_15705 [Acidobacteriaceae bacterium]
MKWLRVLAQMVKADFLERARRMSFLVALAFTVYVGYETFAGGIVINLDKYRGVYNSAWVGALMAAVTSCFLSLVGFYIVKGSIERDEQTRVGRILAATPMTKVFYTVAKALGNFAVLSSMVAVMAVAAVLMQLLRGEDRVVHVSALLGPMVLIALPAMAFVAALAVLFETLPVLRGGVGNVVWFFAWTALLVAGAPPATGNGQHYAARVEFLDFSGLGTIFSSTRETMLKVNPKFTDAFSFNIGGTKPTERFVWNGIDWTAAQVAGRLEWVVLALLAALLAAVFFHRFDPARAGAKSSAGRRRKKLEALSGGEQGAVQDVAGFGSSGAARNGMLTPLARVGSRTRFGHLVVAELRLMLQGQKWWWYAGAAGLFIGCLSSPLVAGRGGVILAAWIWPLLLWSQMGSREARWGTGALLFSSPRTLGRQLPAAWVAGVLVAMATGGGLAIRLMIAHDAVGLAGWMAGAVFIPSLALALGFWTGTGKWFEAIYTGWWYIGPLHHIRNADFMGTMAGSTTPGLFVGLAAILLASCFVRRRAQLGYV